MVTEATRPESMKYGCVVLNKDSSEVNHYVEKPSTFVSTIINCGVYLFSMDIFTIMAAVFNNKQDEYYK